MLPVFLNYYLPVSGEAMRVINQYLAMAFTASANTLSVFSRTIPFVQFLLLVINVSTVILTIVFMTSCLLN